MPGMTIGEEQPDFRMFAKNLERGFALYPGVDVHP
jgi:hypothetical protein